MQAGKRAGEMQMILVPLIALGWVWTLQGAPVISDPLYPTQENFNLTRLLGKWYDVASTYSSKLEPDELRALSPMGILELTSTDGRHEMRRTAFRHGICKTFSAEFNLTSTPGRIVYHVANFSVDVDAYIVHTNYDEYAIMIVVNNKNSTGIKLMSRTTDVRPTILDDYRTLVKEQGHGAEIVLKKYKGDCVPGQILVEPVLKRSRRNVVPTVMAEEEGSADGPPLFKPADSCNAEPDIGPCFGFLQRYYYNATSMSCQEFRYGGCRGNRNNFNTERECLQSCRTEAVCRLPMQTVPCSGEPPVWAFNSSAGVCVAYEKGLCQANGNKFYKMAECEEYCGVVKDDGEFLKAI